MMSNQAKESSSSRTPPTTTTKTTTKTPMVDVDDGGSIRLATSQHAKSTQHNSKGGGGGGGSGKISMMTMMNNLKNRRPYTLRIIAILACCAIETRQIAITRLSDHRQQPLSSVQQQRVQAKRRPYIDNTGNVTITSSASSSPSNNTTSSTAAFLWETSTTIPRWMKEYFAWHHDQVVNHMNQENWQSYRFLVMRCLEYETCGGASDRLQSIPKQIRLAAMSKRLLFIQWTKPAALQEFLVPPMGGMNWTIPFWLDALLDYHHSPPIQKIDSLLNQQSDSRVVVVKDQSHDHGYHFYTQQARAAATTENNNTNHTVIEKEEEEADFDKVFRDVWNVLFIPAPPVHALIDQNMKELSLVPGQYVAVHVRSKYKADKSNNLPMIHNSINCATSTMMLQQQNNNKLPDDDDGSSSSLWPIYFASDSSNATKHAVQYVQQKNASRIAFRKTDREPLHLDRGGSDFLKRSNAWRNNTASDFYDVFVDLYLLANSGCSTIGIGGFGKWGALMSYNTSCIVRHDRNKCPLGQRR